MKQNYKILLIIPAYNEETNIHFSQLTNGLVSNETATNLIEDNKIIKLHENIFNNDALILSNINSNKVTLKNEEKEILEFDFTGFPYLGIWSKKGAPFVCIEPWFNTADKVDSNGKFEDKKDIIKIQPNETFKSCFKVSFK